MPDGKSWKASYLGKAKWTLQDGEKATVGIDVANHVPEFDDVAKKWAIVVYDFGTESKRTLMLPKSAVLAICTTIENGTKFQIERRGKALDTVYSVKAVK